GTWSITTSTLANGTYNLTARAKDTAGNASAQSSALSVTINTTLPPPPGSISGTLFNDLNGNGTRDALEPVLSGWKVFLDTNKNGVADANEFQVITDTNGRFSLPPMPSGSSYTVRATRPTGWNQTAPTNNTAFNLSLSAGQTQSVAFGQTTLALVSG